MSDAIIQVENLGKKYRIAHQAERQRYKALRDVLASKVKGLFQSRKSEAGSRESLEDFWALKDVSFEVKQGEVVGIIGRNGAGKSTLLKILSRITEPTTGRVRLRGRVASLLEVGTGFHPELTGRENVFLNGAILGMHRVEIKRKFDEIVAFAEVEKFLETPVKRYSSGMYVRLAFAVAAHLEPEILIVDEVLAVGDAQFQQKCLAKMKNISCQHGRTVLFVSHLMTTVSTLCSTGILLKDGKIEIKTSATEAISRYISTNSQTTGMWNNSAPKEHQTVYFEKIYTRDNLGRVTADYEWSSPVNLDIEVMVRKAVSNVQLAMRITNQEGIPVLTTCNTDESKQYVPLGAGKHCFKITIPGGLLSPGKYALKINAHVPKSHSYHLIDDEIAFIIHDANSHEQLLKDDRRGVINPVLPWIIAK